jgi:predicted nuclease of restriction endonuclease-like (RecB) superfamily
VELLNLEDAAQQTFYEIECIQGNWSVRELKRQIHSFYYQLFVSKYQLELHKREEIERFLAEKLNPYLTPPP